MITTITKEFEFAAAHNLPNHEGLCKNLHGHNYKLQVTISGDIQKIGSASGMIMDFGDLKKIVKKHILDILDHSNLNITFDNPTAEVMVKWIGIKLISVLPVWVKIYEIKLWETSTSFATWKT